MTELDAELVRRKLSAITRNLDDLATVEGLSLEEYEADRFRRKAVERMLQETVEAATDVNLHLLRVHGASTPGDYYDSFVSMGREGIIGGELAQRLAPSAGLRNRLVHEYDELDHGKVLQAAGDARRDFRDFVAAVEKHLQKEGL